MAKRWPDEQEVDSFARYADDCNVYVGSVKAGERVMELLRKSYAVLKLQINEAKSAVGSAFGRKFLGYALWVIDPTFSEHSHGFRPGRRAHDAVKAGCTRLS